MKLETLSRSRLWTRH